MTNTEILEKIKKLLAVAEGKANVNEAATAAALAQKLMEEHKIQEAELSLEEDEPEPIISDVLDCEPGPSLREWRSNLASVVCIANDCQSYLTLGRQSWGTRGKFKIVGRPGNIQTAQYMFMALSRTVDKLCKKALKNKEGSGRRWANSFRLGAVAEIGGRLRAMKKTVRENATERALVLFRSEREQVSLWMKENLNLRGNHGYCSSLDGRGYLAGRKAGGTVDIGGHAGSLKSSSKQLQA